MKFAVVFAIVGLALVQSSIAQSHNSEWGKREDGDKQLYREIVVKKASVLQIKTKDVHYSGAARITYIKATDQYTNGKGGYASLIKGGAGYTLASVHMKSQRGHGLSYILEIYGI